MVYRKLDEPPGVPRWVKLLVAAAILVAVVLVVTLLAGLEHGPGRHLSGSAGDAPRPVPVAAG